MPDRPPNSAPPLLARPAHLRQAPLFDGDTVRRSVGDHLRVYSAPGYMVFIERMWHGDYQQVPVDPQELDDLITILRAAQADALSEDA